MVRLSLILTGIDLDSTKSLTGAGKELSLKVRFLEFGAE
jgi:hypothetical protein